MAKNFVHAGRRLRVLFSAAHLAGDLVFEKGFYGVVQDDVASGKFGTLILEGVWELARTPATVAMGSLLAAGPSSVATTLVLQAYTPAATANQRLVGKTIATGNATVARVQLLHLSGNPL
jgi:predicted RecA/RadA family phage recombinase